MYGGCLLVESSRVPWGIICITHDIVSEDVEAVSNIFVGNCLYLAVESLEG